MFSRREGLGQEPARECFLGDDGSWGLQQTTTLVSHGSCHSTFSRLRVAARPPPHHALAMDQAELLRRNSVSGGKGVNPGHCAS